MFGDFAPGLLAPVISTSGCLSPWHHLSSSGFQLPAGRVLFHLLFFDSFVLPCVPVDVCLSVLLSVPFLPTV